MTAGNYAPQHKETAPPTRQFRSIDHCGDSRPKMQNGVLITTLLSICVLPLWMGGFLGEAYALFFAGVGFVSSYQIFRGSLIPLRFSLRSPRSVAFFGLFSASISALVLAVLLSVTGGKPHILNQETFILLAWQPVFVWITAGTGAALLFLLLTSQHTSRRAVVNAIFTAVPLAAIGIAAVAVLHWFSDDGRLFWQFTPASRFSSPRTRWPFVNSDHLAAYAAMTLPAVIAQFQILTFNFNREWRKQSARRRTIAHLILSNPSRIRWVAFFGVGIALVSTALLGSLSRTAWFASSVGLVSYFMLTRKGSRALPSVRAHFGPKRRNKPRSAARFFTATFDRIAHKGWTGSVKGLTYIVPLVLLTTVLFTGGAADMISDRIRLDTHRLPDNPRWTLYSDALALFRSSPFFGVGVGQWSLYYPSIASPSLAGARAEYLHSDLLQNLVELGILGVTPFLLAAFCFLRAVLKKIPLLQEEHRRLAAAALSGLMAITICSTFDFALRVPGVLVMAVLILAGLTIIVEEDEPAPNTVAGQ